MAELASIRETLSGILEGMGEILPSGAVSKLDEVIGRIKDLEDEVTGVVELRVTGLEIVEKFDRPVGEEIILVDNIKVERYPEVTGPAEVVIRYVVDGGPPR